MRHWLFLANTYYRMSLQYTIPWHLKGLRPALVRSRKAQASFSPSHHLLRYVYDYLQTWFSLLSSMPTTNSAPPHLFSLEKKVYEWVENVNREVCSSRTAPVYKLEDWSKLNSLGNIYWENITIFSCFLFFPSCLVFASLQTGHSARWTLYMFSFRMRSWQKKQLSQYSLNQSSSP